MPKKASADQPRRPAQSAAPNCRAGTTSVLTAQLHRLPLMEDVAADTTLTIGPTAARPLHLDIPVFVSDMSLGALSAQAKVALGSDGVAVSNSALQAIGCLGMRACHTNNCPVGIATQLGLATSRT